MIPSRYTNAILFVLLAAVWGSAYMVVKGVLPYISPVILAALRYDLAGMLMFGYAVVSTDTWWPKTLPEWRLVVIGGALIIAAHFGFLFTGQQYVTSAIAAVGTSLIPVLTPVFAQVLLPDERLDRMGAIGVALGFLGVAIIANPDSNSILNSTTYGVGLIVLSAVWFALGGVLTRRYRTSLPLPTMQAWMMIVGAALLHAFAWVLPSESLGGIEWTLTAITGLFYLAVVAGAGGFLLYFVLLDRLGAIEINLVDYALPVFAALSGWLVLDENLHAVTFIGFGAIFSGFVLVKRRAIRTELVQLKT